MSDTNQSFRDFGIHPEALQPPAGSIRSYFSTGRVIGQYIGTAIVLGIGLALLALFALAMPWFPGLFACAATLMAFGVVIYLATHNDYAWIKLEDNTLTARHLYLPWTIERQIDEIECLTTMVYPVKTAAVVVMEKMLGRVKGIEIRFRDGKTPLRILRADPAMTNAQELILAVLYRMTQQKKVETEIINFEGRPLVRRVYWEGETPTTPPNKKPVLVMLGLLMLLGLMAGTILGFIGVQLQEQLTVGSVPPQKISIRTLLQNGPGTNRHVTLTDFRAGGYVTERKSNNWTQVWVALFPSDFGPNDPKEIRVILTSTAIKDEASLKQLLQKNGITGICPSSTRSSWGATLGPNLVKANQNFPLASVWEITELREVPTATAVNNHLNASAALLSLVFLFGLIILWYRR